MSLFYAEEDRECDPLSFTSSTEEESDVEDDQVTDLSIVIGKLIMDIYSLCFVYYSIVKVINLFFIHLM